MPEYLTDVVSVLSDHKTWILMTIVLVMLGTINHFVLWLGRRQVVCRRPEHTRVQLDLFDDRGARHRMSGSMSTGDLKELLKDLSRRGFR